MTLAHFIYIPGIFALGMLVGYLLRVKLADMSEQESAESDRRKAARDARRRARTAAADSGKPADAGAAQESDSP